MLIRNAKSFHDLQNKKKLQAELLQLSIDNEAVKEQRVSDYKNPNKPPPIPPQYRTTAEVQADVMEQQKTTIDNLRSLGLDYQVASQISIDMKNLREGDGSYLKFNKFFPSFKNTIEKNVNIKSIGVDGILEEIQRYFDDIDSTMGLNLAGTKSTNYFSNKPLTAVSILPSQEDYINLKADVDDIIALYGLDATETAPLKALLQELITNSPTEEDLRAIDTFPSIERTRINRQIETLINKYNFPTSSFLYNVVNEIDKNTQGKTQLQVRQALASLANSIKMVSKVSIDKIKDLVDKIDEEKIKIFNANLQLGQMVNPNAPAQMSGLRVENEVYLNNKINALKKQQLLDRLVLPAYGGQYVRDIPTTDGKPSEGYNDIFEIIVQPDGSIRRGYFDLLGIRLNYDPNTQEVILQDGTRINIPRHLVKAKLDKRTGEQTFINRYKDNVAKDIVRNTELPQLINRLDTDNDYNPKYHHGVPSQENPTGIDDRAIASHGFGLNKKGGKVFKGRKPKKINDSDSDSDTDIHIDINSHNGKEGEGLSKGFMKRRIKIGKGIEVDKQEPTYKLFGKYVIHIPQLHNNVLNFRYKSLGPSTIRPVEIDDNFKEFIFDVLESGRVNDRHYKTLTDAEKNHFLRAVKGAGIIDTLKLKNENFEKDKEEEERLELLLGEINAGNDNDNIIKEAKTIIKKYISNGKLSRQKGLDMLMHF